MKGHLIIITFATFLFSCSPQQRNIDVDYIKVLSLGRADSITKHNKGLGVYRYFFYEPNKDSVILRVLKDVDLNQYRTFIGRLNNPQYVDSIRFLLDVLKPYGNGLTFDTTNDGSYYCGPELYVEYKDKAGIHFNVFILGPDEAFDRFYHFYSHLEEKNWEKQTTHKPLVDADREAVTAFQRLGLYQKRPTPYVPQRCDSSVDMSKLYGTWRLLETTRLDSEENYQKLILKRDGIWTLEKINKGTIIKKSSGKFTFSLKDNTFVWKTDTSVYKFTIMKLTDNCIEFKSSDENFSIRYDRM